MSITFRKGVTIRGQAKIKQVERQVAQPAIDWDNLSDQKLRASNYGISDNNGRSVQISRNGQYAISGAPSEDTTVTNSGAAYIFKLSTDGTTWAEEQMLKASNPGDDDRYGFDCGISADGTTAIVGAFYEDTGGTNAGMVYIYTRSGTTWTEEQRFTAGDIQTTDAYGVSVAISASGDTVAVGAYTANNRTGAAYIHTRTGGVWTEQQKVTSISSVPEDIFGRSISLSADGNDLLVGAYGTESNTGTAYVFTRSGNVWTEQGVLQSSDRSATDYFSISVEISPDGNTAIVGAYRQSTAATDAGAAYVFTRSGNVWTEQQKLQPAAIGSGYYFGTSVSISSNDVLIVGAENADNEVSINAGTAHVFEKQDGVWTEVRKLISSNSLTDDKYGHAVSISDNGRHLTVAAYRHDIESGVVFFYMAQ